MTDATNTDTTAPSGPRTSEARLVPHGSLYSVGDTTLDLRYGGNYGYAPRIDEWLNNKSYIPRDLVPVVLAVPKMFGLYHDKEEKKWTATLKAFIELHCKTIEGYKATLTVNVAQQPVRDEIQQDPTRVVRERSDPVFGSIEKEGNPIQKFLEWWITYGILDPDSGRILASSLHNAPSDWLSDWYSMSLLVFEPDTMFRHVRRAWVSVNMYPLTTGDIVGLKDPDSDKNILELSIGFSALSVTNEGTRVFAEQILKGIKIESAFPSSVRFSRKVNRLGQLGEGASRSYVDASVAESKAGYAAGIKYVKDHQLNNPASAPSTDTTGTAGT